MELRIPVTVDGARVMLFCLLGVGFGLAVFHLVLQTTDFIPWSPVEALFDMDEETSIPTWFSTLQLFVTGSALIMVALNNRQTRQLPNWLVLAGAAVFILLSLDEGAMVHERITRVAMRLDQVGFCSATATAAGSFHTWVRGWWGY